MNDRELKDAIKDAIRESSNIRGKLPERAVHIPNYHSLWDPPSKPYSYTVKLDSDDNVTSIKPNW